MMIRIDNAHIAPAMAGVTDRYGTPVKDWYLASPFTPYPVKEHAWLDACRMSAAFMACCPDHFVYSPIAETYGIEKVGLEIDHAAWMARDKIAVDRAHGVLVACLPGITDSKGVRMEIEWAKAAQKPVVFLQPIGAHFHESVVIGEHGPIGELTLGLYHKDVMSEHVARKFNFSLVPVED